MSRPTQKFQITIPKSVREVLGVAPGDEIEFSVTADNRVEITRSASASAFSKYIGFLSHKSGHDPDQILNALRGDEKEPVRLACYLGNAYF